LTAVSSSNYSNSNVYQKAPRVNSTNLNLSDKFLGMSQAEKGEPNEKKDGGDGEKEQAIKAVAKGGGIVFIGLLLSKFLGYLYRAVIARFLGPTDYGLISMGLAVLGFATPLALLGINQGIKRYASFHKGKGDIGQIKGSILSGIKIMLLTSSLAALGLFLASDLIAVKLLNEVRVAVIIKIFALSLPFLALLKGFVGSIEAFQKMKYQVISEYLTRNLSRILLAVVLLSLGFGVLGVAYAYFFSILLAAAVAFYLLKKYTLPSLFNNLKAKSNYSELFSYSWPLFLTFLLGSIRSWTDTLMLGYFEFIGTSQVGIYNAALPTAVLITVFLTPVNKIILPVLSELFSQNKLQEIKETYKTATKWIVSFTFPAFLMLAFFSRPILKLLFGKEYMAGYLVLSVLAFAYFINTSVGSAGQILKAVGKTKLIFLNSIASAVLNVLLNYFLIQQWGLIGAAIATGTSIAFVNVLMVTEIYHFLGFHPYKLSFYKPALAALLSSSLTHSIFHLIFKTVPVWSLVPAFALFAFLYGSIFLVIGGLDREDILILKSVEKKSGFDLTWIKKMIKKFVK